MEVEVREIRASPPDVVPENLPEYIAVAPSSVKLLALARKIAQSSSTVLIWGPSGAGKDQLAQYLHFLGNGRHDAYVKIDCSSLPVELIESELFGYEKGAFTGAGQSKPGRLELAGKGTLVLDEIAALELPLQAKLLRVLEEKSFVRLGGRSPIQIQARIVALTNSNLERAVALGSFREDLYYRLFVLPLMVPPLAERSEDILPLAGHFLRQLRPIQPPPAPELRLAPEVRAAMLRYAFPGNVRELRNLLQRAILYGSGERGELTLEQFPDLTKAGAASAAGDLTLSSMEKQHIAAVLQRFRGRKREAAAALGISPKTLLEKRRRYGLDLPWTDRVPEQAARRDRHPEA